MWPDWMIKSVIRLPGLSCWNSWSIWKGYQIIQKISVSLFWANFKYNFFKHERECFWIEVWLERQGLNKWRACCTAATGESLRVLNEVQRTFEEARVKEWRACCTSATGELLRVLNEVQRTFEEARVKEVTGLLHISDRLFTVELSRVEAARGTLQPLPLNF